MKKHYVGSICSEERAARIYDRHAILTHGLKAKTNYSYSKAQVLTLLSKEQEIIYHDISNQDEFTVEFTDIDNDHNEVVINSVEKSGEGLKSQNDVLVNSINLMKNSPENNKVNEN